MSSYLATSLYRYTSMYPASLFSLSQKEVFIARLL